MEELNPLSSLICSLDMGESVEDGGFGFSVEMGKAFSDGTLLPYILSLLSTPELKAIQDQYATTWNGHLPLDPVPPHPEEPHVQWAMPRSRRSPRPSFEGTLSPHTIFPTTLADPHEVEIFFHLVCLFVLFVALLVAMDCVLYSHLLIIQFCADTGVFLLFSFQSDDSAAAQASDAKSNQPRIRRPPTATASLSVPAAAVQQMSINAKQQTHTHQTHTHPPPKKSPAAAPEKVQVQQPGADRSALKELPALRDAPPAKREELFIMKLQLCSVIFTFDDPTADKRGKDMKRQTLLELVDYVNTPAGQKIFTESVMGDLMACISANVCRALPPATDDFDPEEDEPVLEPAWPHLQVAYEFFLRFIVSSEVNAKAAKKYVDQKFCLQLVELFDSEDPRERDYLKTILHRIYGKFMSHRSFIRRAISNVFYRFVYETERHNGIGELLEILGSIINGFAIPLKKEHLQFLVRALIPLHKPKCVALYHQQLSYCIIQYVEKDADTATPILNGFFKCWPWSCSGKQVMFLNELEEILELLGADQLAQVSDMLFTNLARCLDSDHFQVVERALFLWNNEHLVNSGCLSRLNAQTVLPIIYGPLYKNSSGHWNATVEGLAQNVLKMYMEYDLVLYDKCTAAYFREEEEAKRKLEAIQQKWHAIEDMAMANQAVISAK